MNIKVLGGGCEKCKRLEEITREALAELGIEAEISHVTNMNEIIQYPITSTPALVIDEKVKSSGRIPHKDEIAAWLKEAEKG